MRAYTQELFISQKELSLKGLNDLRQCYFSNIFPKLPPLHKVIRFVVTKTDKNGYYCEMDIIVPGKKEDVSFFLRENNIFDFRKRTYENVGKFNAVLVIPTGIGAEIGGHCGDGNATARLLASVCDILITHPNVLNASDINEMTENTFYVEGSILTKFLQGQIGLQGVRSNRVLMLMDRHREKLFNDEVINAVSSARITLGIDCDVYEMKELIESISRYSKSGRAVGEINSLENIFKVIKKYKENYDAIALSTFIKVPKHFHKKYFHDDDMVNAWGGIEAMLTHSIAEIFNMPCAHSPMMTSKEVMRLELGIVDPRKAPETSSTTYLHCILKGLHKSPRIVDFNKGMMLEDVSCMIIPDGCIGLPTLACLENDIPLIAVRENKNQMKNDLKSLPFKKNKLFIVDNYWEVIGIMASLKAGISPQAVRRPIKHTTQIK